MDKKITQRIIGGIVLIAIAIIILPLFLNKSDSSFEVVTSKPLPPFADNPKVANATQTTATSAATVPSVQTTQPEQTVTQATSVSESSVSTVKTVTDSKQPVTTSATTGNNLNSVVNTINEKTTPASIATDQKQPVTTAATTENSINSTISTTNETKATSVTTASAIENKLNPVSSTTTGTVEAANASALIAQQTVSSTPVDIKNVLQTITPPATKVISKNNPTVIVHNRPKQKVIIKSIVAKNSLKKPKQITSLNKEVLVQSFDILSSGHTVKSTNRHKELHKTWVVQMGSFKNKDNARRLTDRLRVAGFKAFTKTVKKGNQERAHVYVGPEFKQASAAKLSNRVAKQIKMQGIVMPYNALAL